MIKVKASTLPAKKQADISGEVAAVEARLTNIIASLREQIDQIKKQTQRKNVIMNYEATVSERDKDGFIKHVEIKAQPTFLN
jgi:hypothetical protein